VRGRSQAVHNWTLNYDAALRIGAPWGNIS
jgi:hypothetical protein